MGVPKQPKAKASQESKSAPDVYPAWMIDPVGAAMDFVGDVASGKAFESVFPSALPTKAAVDSEGAPEEGAKDVTRGASEAAPAGSAPSVVNVNFGDFFKPAKGAKQPKPSGAAAPAPKAAEGEESDDSAE